MTNNKIDIYDSKENIYTYSVVAVFLLIIQFGMVFQFKWIGLLICIPIFIPTYFLIKSLYKRFKKPLLEIYDDCINYPHVSIKIYFEDIKSINIEEGKNYSIILTLKDKEKYKDIKFKHPPFEKDKILLNMFLMDFDKELLEKELKKRINDSSLNISENLDIKKEVNTYVPNVVGFGTRFFSIFGVFFLTIYCLI